jgi:hypothetical protein
VARSAWEQRGHGAEGAVRRFKELDDNASHTPDVGSCHRSNRSTISGAAECASDWSSGTEVNRRTPVWASNENAA